MCVCVWCVCVCGDRWLRVEMVARQHLRVRVVTPHPLATEQHPVQALGPAPNLRPLTRTCSQDPMGILELCSSLDKHLQSESPADIKGKITLALLILAHFSRSSCSAVALMTETMT